jgi:hypothetical protein
MAAPDLLGATQPHRRRCDETEAPARQTPQPTRLAPSRTLTQPAVSPRPLVGSYPTGSPLTRAHQERWRVYFLLRLWSGRGSRRPALTCCFVRRPCFIPAGNETGSREVPLAATCRQRRLTHPPGKHYTTGGGGCQSSCSSSPGGLALPWPRESSSSQLDRLAIDGESGKRGNARCSVRVAGGCRERGSCITVSLYHGLGIYYPGRFYLRPLLEVEGAEMRNQVSVLFHGPSRVHCLTGLRVVSARRKRTE